ncbi:MAG: MFS transporter [Thermomicrobiales bacterium]|nr:MFS transporter [Thermomicrobiales bacterium]
MKIGPRMPDITFAQRGLWGSRDFRHLWAGQTISTFGSVVSNIAIPFAAIIELDATPFDLAALRVAQVAPAFVVGLVAGAIADRTARRPLLIGADVARAILLALVPLAALFDQLSIWLLLFVSVGISVLSLLFDVAYQSYVPHLVGRDHLLEANSKMTATNSVAESSAFALGGWLVQLLTAPFAILVNAVSFSFSAFAIRRTETPEEPPARTGEFEPLLREAISGLGWVKRDDRLLSLAAATALFNASTAIFGTLFLLYVSRDLGFEPGSLGLIFAVGGVTSLIGAFLVRRVVGSLGDRRAMVAMFLVVAIGNATVPLSPEISVAAVGFLIANQVIVDPAWTILDISTVSFRQRITPDAWLGRVTGTFRVLEFGAVLAGSLGGAWIGSEFGLKTALWLSVGGVVVAALPLLLASNFDSGPEQQDVVELPAENVSLGAG